MTGAAEDENVYLRRYLRDLVALSTLPAAWVGEPRQAIADSVAEALLRALLVDFVYVRLAATLSDPIVETLSSAGAGATRRPYEVGQTLAPWIRPDGRVRVPSIPNPLGEGTVHLAVAWMGRVGNSLGVIAAGVQRSDFPTRFDLLLMNVVANQAATSLQGAQLREVQAQLGEQRRTEDVLRRSEERFRALIEHSSDIITLHHRDRTMTYVSPSTARILGYEPDDLLGEHAPGAVHPADLQRVGRIWTEMVARPGSVTTFRYRLRHADGTWRWVEATGTNLLDEPAVEAVVINRRDVTHELEAQHLLEERVAERTRQLESLYRADETLYRSLRLEDVLQALIDVSADVLGIEKAMILASDNPTDPTVVLAARGFPPGALQAQPRTAKHLTQVLEAEGVRAEMGVPIASGGEIFAVFNVYYTTPHRFSEEERRLLVALAQRAGLAIENARLYEAARGVAAIEERQKLARELHDSVSQALYAIALNAASAQEVLASEHVQARGLVSDVLRLAEAGLAEMRALIFELRPESLESEGLAGAIEKQVAAVQARHNLRVTTTMGPEPEVPLPTKEAVYRIAQEALHNIAKHARARTIELTLEEHTDELILRIADDGRGFDPSATFPGHLGLLSMRERAAAIGGTVEIQSAHGEGTHVTVQVPTTPRGSPRAG